MMKGFFSYLVSVALFPPGAIIRENESDALVIKSLIYTLLSEEALKIWSHRKRQMNYCRWHNGVFGL